MSSIYYKVTLKATQDDGIGRLSPELRCVAVRLTQKELPVESNMYSVHAVSQ